MAEQQTYNADAAANQGQPDQSGAPQINLGDFQVMVAIIDTVAKRGGFEGPELSDVGTLRTRLEQFIQFHQPKDDAGDPNAVSAQSSEAEPETLEFDEAETLADEPVAPVAAE